MAMRRASHVLALIAALLPAAAAAQGDHFLRLIAMGLREYRIETDVTRLTNAQAAALHLRLSSPEEDRFGVTDFRTRQMLLSILRWNDATNPDLR